MAGMAWDPTLRDQIDLRFLVLLLVVRIVKISTMTLEMIILPMRWQLITMPVFRVPSQPGSALLWMKRVGLDEIIDNKKHCDDLIFILVLMSSKSD